MPILGFFKRGKSKEGAASRNTSRTSIATTDDGNDILDSDYVLPPIGKGAPSLMNGNGSQASIGSTSSTKIIKLPFRGRSSNASASPLSASFDSKDPASDYSTMRSSMDLNTLDSSAPSHSRPSFTSIFSSHEALTPTSTRSMPASHTKRPDPSPLQREDPGPAPRHTGGILSWARERTKSKPSKPSKAALLADSASPSLPRLSTESSFNLKSFRHIQADISPNASSRNVAQSPPSTIFVSPSPRPRGGSMASDTSQRISVAAFREAQARRSSTNLASHSPSPRPISLADSTTNDRPPPRPPRADRPAASPARDARVRSIFSTGASSSEDATSTGEEDTDSGDQSPSRSRLGRQRTITKQTYGTRARSDMGHGGGSEQLSTSRIYHHQQTTSSRSEVGHAPQTRNASPFRNAPPPSSFQPQTSSFVGTRSHSVYKRERASYSMSELSPSASAKRVIQVKKANERDSIATTQPPANRESDTSDSESSNSSSDDDDAPLSRLVNPPRPGSAVSHASRASRATQQQRKPLIDLNTKFNPVTGKPASVVDEAVAEKKTASHLRPLLISSTDINDRLSRLTSEAGIGVYLGSTASKSEDNLGKSNGSTSPRSPEDRPFTVFSSSSFVASPVDMQPPEIIKSIKGDSALLATTTPSPSSSTDISPSTVGDHGRRNLDDKRPLRPIPVKERTEHNSGFRVVSRPQKSPSATSQTSVSQSTPAEPSRASQSFQPSSPPHKPSSPKSSSSPTKEVQRTSPSKFPPRTSSFTVTSRPLSGASQNSQTSPGPTKSSSTANISSIRPPHAPTYPSSFQRPFAANKRRDSPASSTGGSSNGRGPSTPMDGSDYFSPERGSGSSPSSSGVGFQSAMKGGRGHIKRGSGGVTFQEPGSGSSDINRGRLSDFGSKNDEDMSLHEREHRRKERRRSEAKAAIELGNVINGPGPKLEDDDDDQPLDGNMGPRMSMFNQMNQTTNPAMRMGWQQNLQIPPSGPGMLTPQQFGMPQMPMNMGSDPSFLIAHQQAMMIAKQAYQYAVAQQAMAAAADEWERSSNVGGGYAQSTMGGSSVGFGLGGMMGAGVGMGMNGWGAGGSMFPAAPRSMYAGSAYGGLGSEAGWGSASVYGEAFGPSLTTAPPPRRPRMSNSASHDSIAFPSSKLHPDSANATSSRSSRPPGRSRTNTAPSNTPLPAQHRSSAAFRDQVVPPLPTHGGRKPPSSWKAAA